MSSSVFLSSRRPTPLSKTLSKNFHIARHVFLVAAPVGILVGAAVAAYDYVVNALLWDHFSAHLNPVLLSLLPILGMALTGAILAIFRVTSSSMADEVVLAYHKPEAGMNYRQALPKLGASVATMGFGASAGMEGASKWLGGMISSFVQSVVNRSRRLKPLHGRIETTMIAGASAGIAAIFRAPLTGAIMGVESPYKHDLAHESLIHALMASATSYATFCFLRPSTSYFPIHFTYHIHTRDLLLCVPVGLLGGLASHLFLYLLKKCKRRWALSSAPRIVKTGVGGILVSGVALLSYRVIGEPATLQAGLPVANRLLNGHYVLWVCLFLLGAKILATAFTFGSGGVGGLFVPSATIGAALGAACDLLFHPSQPGLFTLVGIAAFAGASYNSLLFAAVFVAEATGSATLVVPSLIASCTAFLISAGISNSESQKQKRPTDEALLASFRCRDWMTTKIVVAYCDHSLTQFAERSLHEHPHQELPVIAYDGRFLGLASLRSLRSVPKSQWISTSVEKIMDPGARTVCAEHSMAYAEKELARGNHDYLPVIDPATDQLIGILSMSDILRARHRAQDILRPDSGDGRSLMKRLEEERA
jgi:chloride channel protein, CIC family